MKLRKLFVWTVILPLLLQGCGGGKTVTPELPPPVVTPPGGGGSGDDGGGGGDDPSGSHPWDANRGKVVTPSGTGWTSKTIDEGVVYYAFSGTDALSGQKEEIFAVDLDLSKSQYQVKLLYTRDPRLKVSEAFKLNANTVAAMNANFELNSIFVRVDGTTRYQIPNNVVC